MVAESSSLSQEQEKKYPEFIVYALQKCVTMAGFLLILTLKKVGLQQHQQQQQPQPQQEGEAHKYVSIYLALQEDHLKEL